ncbi:hypothetical protein CHS0354_015230 [Potamilus streckersoni]|uniref:Uncharacterized protein n=1 Tax=Potamilus streckersoni TaxID=2493646 RepID=A0AAE0RR29_9BIVA|nr:hypothetical protein CHS0354_015230 [Potamilus streckersoni]
MDRSDIRWKTISKLCKPHIILTDIREQNYYNIPMPETRKSKRFITPHPEHEGDLTGVKLKGLKKWFSKIWSRIHRSSSEVQQYNSDSQNENVDYHGERYKVLGSLVNFSRNTSICESYENRRSQMTEIISSPTWLFERSHYSPCSGPISIQSKGEFCARSSVLESPSTVATTGNYEDILKGFGLKRHKSCMNRPNTLRLQRLLTRNRYMRPPNETDVTKVDVETLSDSSKEIGTIEKVSTEERSPKNNTNKWKAFTEKKLLRTSSHYCRHSLAGQINWEERQAKVVTIFTRTAKSRIRYGRKEHILSFETLLLVQ